MIIERDYEAAIAATLCGSPITTECAACYHIGPCVDDGEAYICVDRAACNARARAAEQPPRVSFFSLAFEQAERELGEKLGYPALVYGEAAYRTATATPGYVGIFAPSGEMSEAETAARLNALEQDNAGLLALLREIDYADPARTERLLAHASEQAHPGRELMARTLEEVVSLRLAIDDAHQHVGALLSMLPPTSINKDRNASISAARAWLRRGAPCPDRS